MNETIITARMHKDGTVVEVLPDGSERPFPKQPVRHMTEEEIHAAAQSNPDARPMTEAELRNARRVPRVNRNAPPRIAINGGGVCSALPY